MTLTTLRLEDLLTVAGIAVLTALFTQLAKGKIAHDWVPHAAVLFGVLAAVAAALAIGAPATTTLGAWLGNAVLTGVMGGAGAVFIYEAQKPAGILPPRPDEPHT
jgi:hypothetical protein